MTMPASGQIKMSEINTELGRSSNAQISLDDAESGVYATINTNSSSRPDTARPASLSEWYSYNHSAAPPNYDVTVQAQGDNGGSSEAAEVYYKIGAGAWTLLSSANLSGSYASYGTFSVPSGSTVYFAVKKNSDADDCTFGTGNGGGFTGFCGKTTTPSTTISATTTYYLNVSCVSGGIVTC